MNPSDTIVNCSFINALINMSIGMMGSVIRESLNTIVILSVSPPLNPVMSPTMTAMIREKKAVIIPKRREFLTAKVSLQKISCPIEFVPSMCSKDGGRSLGRTPHNVGSYGEKNDSIDRKAYTQITMKLNLNLLSLIKSLNHVTLSPHSTYI